MAGKTLSGIGDDESGRHELGSDAAASASASGGFAKKPPSTRPTDRMPMYIGTSGTPTVGAGAAPAVASGGANVDEDKVAEGLKKLRSLDEPLGPIPTSSTMPTLRDGPAPLTLPKPSNPMGGTPTLKETPVVGLPTPVNPQAIAAAAAAELIRARGTAHGHALSAAVAGQTSMPVSVDDRMKGTLLGHDLHLPDLPPLPSDDARSAEVRPVAPAHDAGALVRGSSSALEPAHDSHFSQGDSHFFDNQTDDEEFAPENPRGKMMVRGAIFLAVVSVFVVAALAWGRFHKADAPAEAQAPASAPPTEAQAAVPAPAPTEAQPAAAAPAPAAPPTAQAPAAAPPPPPAPPPVAAVPEEEVKPAVVEAPPAAHPKPKHPAVAARPVAAAPHAAKPAAPPHDTKPPTSGKKAKDEDPDGTLPLTE
jgi:hypothetical protein